MQPVELVPAPRLEVGRLQPDVGPKAVGVVDGEVQGHTTADRAAHHHRAIESEALAEREDQLRVGLGREEILLVAPSGGREGLPVPGHVEGHDPEPVGDRAVRHQVPVLAPVRPRGVQADERDAASRLLEVDAVGTAAKLQVHVAAGDRLDAGGGSGHGHGSNLLEQGARRGAMRPRVPVSC